MPVILKSHKRITTEILRNAPLPPQTPPTLSRAQNLPGEATVFLLALSHQTCPSNFSGILKQVSNEALGAQT